MKIYTKLGTHSARFMTVDGRSLGRKRPVPVGKRIRIKDEWATWGKWETVIVDKVYSEDEYSKDNLHFVSFL